MLDIFCKKNVNAGTSEFKAIPEVNFFQFCSLRAERNCSKYNSMLSQHLGNRLEKVKYTWPMQVQHLSIAVMSSMEPCVRWATFTSPFCSLVFLWYLVQKARWFLLPGPRGWCQPASSEGRLCWLRTAF